MLPLSSKIPYNQSIRNHISQYKSEHDPETILKEVAPEIDKILDPDSVDLVLSDYFKAITLDEFRNGVLMCDTLPDQFRTFAIEMMRKLQQEYNCQTTSEKSLCEMATMAYIRIYEYQQLMFESEKYQANLVAGHTCGENNPLYSDINRQHSYFGCNACNRAKIEQQHYQTLGKELDRANRHYLTAIQTLRMMKQQPLQVTVRANTAIIGQNQMVQTNNHG